MNLIVGLLAGLFVGVSLAFFQEYLDSSVRSLEDVRNYLKLFPLGMVPKVQLIREGEEDEGEEGKREGRFWLANDPKIPLYVAEAYRIIRTNIAFGSVDNALKTLQVTSAVKGEGKTTTAANLAVSFALAGSRVLLVDADLRRPSIHKILGLEGIQYGLTDALMDGKSWESLMTATSVPNLFCLSAGEIPSNPSELLASKRMKAIIEEVKESFDIVIFDSPPVISVSDSAIVASRVDGTILVSRSGFIPRHLCLQAKTALESVNGRLIGCVLNSVESENQPYYYHQYSREYGRYREEEEAASSLKEDDEPLDWGGTFEKLKALREPFLVLLTTSWSRLGGRLRSDRLKKETRPKVDAL